MAVQQTSINAFMDLGNTEHDQITIILSKMNEGETYTNRELSKLTGISISSITPRVKSLRDKSIVEHAGNRKCTITGRTVMSWRRL